MTPDRHDPITAHPRDASTQDAPVSVELQPVPAIDAAVPHTQPEHATAITVVAADATAPDATRATDTAKFPVAPILHHARQRYQIVAEHGHGGLGRVSRAHDRDLGRDVAIKELISRNELAEARFLREALITARLEHPGIVPVHEAGRWPDGTPFYAMKLVAGRPLRDLIAERKTVDERIGLLHHVIAVADAIAYAHGRNIIHRDLKPANVIVGDFGETIVIDWGLAKDLSASEIRADDAASPNTNDRIAPCSGGTKPAFLPAHTAVDSASLKDLTTTGSVLGTPAYMPPEQERGEHVDQRADVFAIGAMLWELCSLQKVPPMEPRLRYRILSKAGIDRDLISILNKALEPDPARRYFDAGELATDLKAFKAGTHISSRAHSLAARVDRWQRRHRRTAGVSLLVIATFFATLVYYVFNIREARDRADAALLQSVRATSALASERDTLVLRNAELLLVRDPTATITELSNYRGRDANRAKQLRAEATALGTSSFQVKPHTANVWWAHKMADGSILSFSKDGTLKHTAPNGDSRTLAANGSGQTLVRFAPARGLLLYACKPAALCIFDVHELDVTPRTIQASAATSASFSPSGKQLVYITSTGDTYLVDIANLNNIRADWILRQPDASDALFLDERHIGLGAKDSNFVVALDDLSTVHKMSAPQGTLWSADTENKIIAQAFSDGTIALFDFEGTERRRKSLCVGHITTFVFVPILGHIVFGCEDGIVGTWTTTNVAPRKLARVAAAVDSIVFSQGYVVAAISNGSIAVVARDTGAITSLQGHLGRISSLERVDGVRFELLTGDNQGSIRLWRPDLIPLSTWAVTDEPHTAYGFGLGERELLATTPWGVVYEFDASVPSHPTTRLNTKGNDRLAVSPDGHYFATYGNSATLELWKFSPLTLVATADTRQSALHTVVFLEDNSLATLGQDGSLKVWTPSLQLSWQDDLAEHIVAIAASPQGSVVAATVTGQLWHLARISARRLLIVEARPISLFFEKAANQFVAVYSTGQVYRIDTYGNTSAWVTTIPGEIRQARASSHAVSAVTMDGRLYVLSARDHAWSSFDERSLPLSSAVKDFAMTEDGMIVLLGADKRIWIYSISLNDWYCIIGALYDFRLVEVSRSQHIAAISDNMGHAYRLDLSEVRQRMRPPL